MSLVLPSLCERRSNVPKMLRKAQLELSAKAIRGSAAKTSIAESGKSFTWDTQADAAQAL
eukprot:CAMPEP_0115555902 /NCGR_PEP_ID=MMETSP0271-20121206/98063_1 /TAXON_ID=71861 /ORGANISM="Scrippsiella trochoidea, Strain CCMP3099" /LENGTH=59 /DNA_ID=CAMNT_0002989703 /DNA_START=191 /DNA_END=367 /DNA_ORIENTATION=+